MISKRFLRRCTFAAADYIAVLIAEIISVQIARYFFGIDLSNILGYSYMYLWIPCIFIVFFICNGIYHMRPLLVTMQRLFYGTLYAQLMALLFIHITQLKYFHIIDRAGKIGFYIIFVVTTFIIIYAIHVLVAVLLKKSHVFYEKVLFIGAGNTAEKAVRFYEEDWGYRYNIVGFVDDRPKSKRIIERFSLVGGLSEAAEIVKNSQIKTVVITMPGLGKEKLTKLISDIQPYTRNISFCPDIIGMQMSGVEAVPFFSEQMMMLKLRNNLARKRNRIYKRIFDLVFTIVGGVCISPILLLITLLVAVDNKGSVIFAHRRVGKDGKEFPCYKFQTMVPDAQTVLEEYLRSNPEARREWEDSFKLTNDPRITKLGAFLRKTSLDELPQLWNVIKGEMSLVGPRPIVRQEVEKYGDNFKEYAAVIPGITGMWQVSGRSDTTYPERVAMDAWYVRNWSVWIDLMCLVKTFSVVLKRKGAY